MRLVRLPGCQDEEVYVLSPLVCARSTLRWIRSRYLVLRGCGCPSGLCWLKVPETDPSADNWAAKALRRRTTGSGRMRHLKDMPRRAKNGFREGMCDFFFPSATCSDPCRNCCEEGLCLSSFFASCNKPLSGTRSYALASPASAQRLQ